MDPLRIATRGSRLAVAQTTEVAELLRCAHEGLRVELVTLSTRGDRTVGPLAAMGGKGLFTAELEQTLRAGRVDLAVHSAKDMPAELPGDMRIVACSPRCDPRDSLVSRDGLGLDDLPPGARVGTGSPRRKAQLLARRADLEVVAIRGNVETRLGKAISGELDAVVLAMAGLVRSGLAERHAGSIRPLELDVMIPAAGQGVLAIQALALDRTAAERAAAIDDPPAHSALLAERTVVLALLADCTSPVGVHVYPSAGAWAGLAMVAAPDGVGEPLRVVVEDVQTARYAGEALIERLLARGAAETLRRRG